MSFAETVYALIVVSCDENLHAFIRNMPNDCKVTTVQILILINHKMFDWPFQ